MIFFLLSACYQDAFEPLLSIIFLNIYILVYYNMFYMLLCAYCTLFTTELFLKLINSNYIKLSGVSDKDHMVLASSTLSSEEKGDKR